MKEFYYTSYLELGNPNSPVEFELIDIIFNDDESKILDFKVHPRDIREFRNILTNLIDSECEERNMTIDQLEDALNFEYGRNTQENLVVLSEASDDELELYLKDDLFADLGKPIDVKDLE